MTEWPAAIDRRYHDAVIFNLDCLVIDTASHGLRAFDSAVPLLCRLQFVTVTVADTEPGGKPDAAVVIETARRPGVRPDRCAVIENDQPAVSNSSDSGFSLVIGLDRNGNADTLLSCGADAVIADLAEISVRSGDAAMSTIPDALQVYSQLKELVTARRPTVFLDFDGTLSDIVEHTESATLVNGAAEAMQALAERCAVGVISGRDLADVRDRVNVEGCDSPAVTVSN